MRGPLAGLPIAVKDNMVTEGVTTTCASKILRNYQPVYTATAVRQVWEDHVVMLGKTNLDEFAMGSSTENSAYQVTAQPVGPRARCRAARSGGSAAAVAAGEALWALGSDTGGSIRQPAALCGIVGMKPTYGAVSRYGLIAFASSLDQIGPLTRSVYDCALLLQHIVGRDPRDATSVELPEPVALPDARAARRPAHRHASRSTSPSASSRACARASTRRSRASRSSAAPASRSACRTPSTPCRPTTSSRRPRPSANLARFDGVRYGYRCAEPADLLDLYERTRGEGFGPEVKRRIMIGTYALSAGYYDAYYGQAQKVRTLMRRDFDAAFADVDLIASPDVAHRGLQGRLAHRPTRWPCT